MKKYIFIISLLVMGLSTGVVLAANNVLTGAPKIDLENSSLTINGAPGPYNIKFFKLSVDPVTGRVEGRTSTVTSWETYSLNLLGTLERDASSGWWYIKGTFTGADMQVKGTKGEYVKYSFSGVFNLKGSSLQEAMTSWTDEGKSVTSKVTILSSEAKGMPPSWELLKGTYDVWIQLNIAGDLRARLNNASGVVAKPKPATPPAPSGDKKPGDICSKKFGPNFKLKNAKDKTTEPSVEDDCMCEVGYERVQTGTGVFDSGKPSCLSVTRTTKDFGEYLGGDSVVDVAEAVRGLQGKENGERVVVKIKLANGKEIKMVIIKNGPDNYLYSPDGVGYYDALVVATANQGASFRDSWAYMFSPFNWGSLTSADGKLIPDKEGTLISRINEATGKARFYNSVKYHKEFIAGAYEYIKARAKYSPESLISSEQDSDSLIEIVIPHIRNSVFETSFDLIKRADHLLQTRGQDVGANPTYDENESNFRLLSEADLQNKAKKQKLVIYAQYELIYQRYLISKQLSAE